jgi:hypothetical protein
MFSDALPSEIITLEIFARIKTGASRRTTTTAPLPASQDTPTHPSTLHHPRSLATTAQPQPRLYRLHNTYANSPEHLAPPALARSNLLSRLTTYAPRMRAHFTPAALASMPPGIGLARARARSSSTPTHLRVHMCRYLYLNAQCSAAETLSI